jgi:hypothetical protein
MGKLEFAIWDGFGVHEMATSLAAADVSEKHLREAQLVEELGYDIFCANHRFGPMPQEQSLKSLALFGKEVIPALS